ncbi:MAG TPA: hypothetical protein VEX70_06600, partial [Pyrinomonadaceae bacterium]|nr:hypothetical protein [Pyrinomonadaceae bacterium]
MLPESGAPKPEEGTLRFHLQRPGEAAPARDAADTNVTGADNATNGDTDTALSHLTRPHDSATRRRRGRRSRLYSRLQLHEPDLFSVPPAVYSVSAVVN